MTLSVETANKVYDILESIGASTAMRKSFVYTHTKQECNEWRFQGKLGFGGKFWNEWSYIEERYRWRVSCYTEDKTERNLEIIHRVNIELNVLSKASKDYVK
jgi:hypothetical protein